MTSTPSSRSASHSKHQQDFDLHGVVGVRVLDGSASDIAAVRRQLGPLECSLDREPDITIRFVDALPRSITLVDVDETGFDDDNFYLLRAKGGNQRRTLIPFDQLGRTVELVCEHGISAVPHLLAAINLNALAKKVLPLHATALLHDGAGVLVTGWSKGGKTETLLAATREGAQYVGDEWVYLTPDGQMLGLPEPIRLWSWQLAQFPELLAARSAKERGRLRTWRTASRVAETVGSRAWPGTGLVRRAAPRIARQSYLQVPPTDLFGQDGVVRQASVDAVVLVVSHESADTVAQPVAPGEIAARMRASLAEEREPLMTHYRHFLFAFPDRHNSVLESAEDMEANLLTARLDGLPSAKVAHPHPCDIRTLGRTVLDAARAARGGPDER